MWQRFTERARKVVFYSQEEAQKYGEGYVSTEHLLLGIIREDDCVAARVLDRLGVSRNRVRAEVEKQLPRQEPRPNQDMTLTPRAKRVIDLAYDEARNLNNNYIGSEHLLLGLVKEGDGLAGKVLAKLGVDLEGARRTVIELQDPSRVHDYDVRAQVRPTRDWQYQQTMSRVQEWARWAHGIQRQDLPLSEEIADLHAKISETVSELNRNLILALCLEIQEGGSLHDSENWQKLRLSKEQAEAMAKIGAELRELLDK
jgi:ATP-dependent Clp protease ATP-binding subunit ClpA